MNCIICNKNCKRIIHFDYRPYCIKCLPREVKFFLFPNFKQRHSKKNRNQGVVSLPFDFLENDLVIKYKKEVKRLSKEAKETEYEIMYSPLKPKKLKKPLTEIERLERSISRQVFERLLYEMGFKEKG